MILKFKWFIQNSKWSIKTNGKSYSARLYLNRGHLCGGSGKLSILDVFQIHVYGFISPGPCHDEDIHTKKYHGLLRKYFGKCFKSISYYTRELSTPYPPVYQGGKSFHWYHSTFMTCHDNKIPQISLNSLLLWVFVICKSTIHRWLRGMFTENMSIYSKDDKCERQS